ncbi:MAG: CheR family methyltransferase [Planctomycetota bacterium]
MNPPKHSDPAGAAELSDRDFRRLSALVYERSGIQLTPQKQTLVRNRLSRRIRARGLRSFEEYLDLLLGADRQEEEFDRMLESICTHVTEFFREPAHFDYLARIFAPRRKSTGRLRILSAGCSSGEEPYSIAICLNEALGPDSPVKIQVEAVDLSASILNIAQAGIYHAERVRKMPRQVLHRYFLKGGDRFPGQVRVTPEIRRCVQFRRMNLIRPERFDAPFDAIFCRNVIIYFDRQTQLDCFRWFHESLAPGGVLFLGHSESLIGADHDFEYVQPTVYMRKG